MNPAIMKGLYCENFYILVYYFSLTYLCSSVLTLRIKESNSVKEAKKITDCLITLQLNKMWPES